LSKQKNFFSNGNKIWVWILIIVFVVGLIGAVYVDRYKNKETCERSIKNFEKIAEHETRLEVQDTKLDNIQRTVDKIDEKLDEALGR
jgi:hypothetical protein